MAQGAVGLIFIFLILILVSEVTLFAQNLIQLKLELRRGFIGVKSSPLSFLGRQMLKLLRIEGTRSEIFQTSVSITLFLIPASLIPLGLDFKRQPRDHSLWLFWVITVFSPLALLLIQNLLNQGKAWGYVLKMSERGFATFVPVSLLLGSVVLVTGIDSLENLVKIQNGGHWLIFKYPVLLPALIGMVFVQKYFSLSGPFRSLEMTEKREGWRLDHLSPSITEGIISLFLVTVFLGGASTGLGIFGGVELIVKTIFFNLISNLVFATANIVTERQGEDFILWRLVPASAMILAIAIFWGMGS